MIDPQAITTYSQYNEDIILLTLLEGVSKGFYVDVGANYPVIDSVTKLFYDKGWSGINIEPIVSLHKELTKARSRDINLQCGAGSINTKATLREYIEIPGHSTFESNQQKNELSKSYQEYSVDIRPLKDIFIENNVTSIHFLKIDVEGYEYEVVKGNDWQRYRPEVICIEANHVAKDWRPLLRKAEYTLFIADGLNEYYVAQESWHHTDGFAERAVKIDYHALKQHQYQSWSEDSSLLVKMNEVVPVLNERISTMRKEISILQHETSLTLSNRPFLSRLKRAAYGLTIDWWNFKKRSN